MGPVDWTGLDIAPANLAWQEGHCNPVESSGVHIDYVGEGKDLQRFRDDAKDMMFRVVMDVNNMSAHGVQDNGEGYNEVLIRLSAEDKM